MDEIKAEKAVLTTTEGITAEAKQTTHALSEAQSQISKSKPDQKDFANFPVGSKRDQYKNPPYQSKLNYKTEINGRVYSGHAQDQMQNRGIVPSVVENTIKNGQKTIQENSKTTRFHEHVNNITVILNETGDVVTVYYGKKGI